MVTDKNGEPLGHFDIIYVEPTCGQPPMPAYYALVIRTENCFGLMQCSANGVSSIYSPHTTKVGHFPSMECLLPVDVKYAYIRHLNDIKLERTRDIDYQISYFVNTFNRVNTGKAVKRDG